VKIDLIFIPELNALPGLGTDVVVGKRLPENNGRDRILKM
jgi:hypothetical protein